MAKLTLDFEEAFDLDFQLIGIACHHKDYRLAWSINKSLEIDFERIDNLDLIVKGQKAEFSVFKFEEEEDFKTYYLIANRSDKGLLIPERKEADYFLQLHGEFSDQQIKEIKAKIQKVKFVLTSFQIDPTSLKSGNNLLI